MLGERIRDARHASGLSLAAVAERAEISAATLSRIERNKQALDLGLFLVLAAIVRVTPSELLAGTDQDSGNGDELVRRLAAMKTEERTRLWRELTKAIATSRDQRPAMQARTVQIEEVLAHLEYLSREIEMVRQNIRRRS